MIVVSNTSPITNLAAIQRFELLQRLFGRIHIPKGVEKELNAFGRRWPGSIEVEQSDWVEVHSVTNRPLVTALQRDLDRGESETIALAIDLQADLVLMDEQEGRRLAIRQGFEVTGVVGVLLLAKRQGLVESVLSELHALRNVAGFFIGDALMRRVGELTDER